MNENMNANSVKLPLVVRIALWLWIVTSLGGAIYCFIFEGEVDYKEPLRVFDEVLILGSIVTFIVEFAQIVRLYLRRSNAVNILVCCEFLDLLFLPLTYRSLAETGESLLGWVFPAAFPHVATILLLLSPSARQWVALTRKNEMIHPHKPLVNVHMKMALLVLGVLLLAVVVAGGMMLFF